MSELDWTALGIAAMFGLLTLVGALIAPAG
jgi:hypothetical protein